MYGAVIGGKIVWMVDKGCPNAFEYKGGWYVHEEDYLIALEWYKGKNCKE